MSKFKSIAANTQTKALNPAVKEITELNVKVNALQAEFKRRNDGIKKELSKQIQAFAKKNFPGKTKNGTAISDRVLRGWDEKWWSKDNSVSEHRGPSCHHVRIGKGKVVPHLTQAPITYFVPFINHSHILLEAKDAGLDKANAAIQSIAYQLVTSIHPSNVQIIGIDPIGLGEKLKGLSPIAVNQKIYQDESAISDLLNKKKSHISLVIQKYLSTNFSNIDEYNSKAGNNIAEPYTLICIANFPNGWSSENAKKIMSLASNGVKAGLHLLISWDSNASMPYEFDPQSVKRYCQQFIDKGSFFSHQIEVNNKNHTFEVVLENKPSNNLINSIKSNITKEVKNKKNVQISFMDNLPKQLWTESAESKLVADIGQIGISDRQNITFGIKGHHALIGGRTGMGKSVLLHAIILKLAYLYSPDELQFSLIDFKQAVEFQLYKYLPHVRVLGLESDREFGVLVLEDLVEEMKTRGTLFNACGASNLKEYRAKTGKVMPRVLLVLDEFQVLFSHSDKINNRAEKSLDALSRMARSFGIHIILATQTTADVDLKTSVLKQFGIRIALGLESSDSEKILGMQNDGAAMLSRPGEAIYNDDNQRKALNKRFQVYFSEKKDYQNIVQKLHQVAKQRKIRHKPFVYQKNNQPNLLSNAVLKGMARQRPQKVQKNYDIFLGDSPSLSYDHFSVCLKKQAGHHILIVGNDDSVAFRITLGTMSSVIANNPEGSKIVYFVNHDNSTSEYNDYLDDLSFNDQLMVVPSHKEEALLSSLVQKLDQRQNSNAAKPTILVCIYGIHNTYSYEQVGFDPSTCGGHLNRLISDGAQQNIHVLIWSSTLSKLNGTDVKLKMMAQRIVLSNEARPLIDTLAHHGTTIGDYEGYMITPDNPDDPQKFTPYDLDLSSRKELDQLESWFK